MPEATTSSRDDRQRAFEIIKQKSFVRGEVTLASGQKSDHYFDLKPTMFDPEGALVLSRLLFDRMKDLNIDLAGGLEMGAVPLIAPLAMVSGMVGQPIPGFFVRKAAKDHGTRKLIDAVGDISGKRIAVVEDVTTTGGSAMKAIRHIEEAGGKVVLVISVLDRQSGAAELYAEAGIPFQSLFTSSEFLKS